MRNFCLVVSTLLCVFIGLVDAEEMSQDELNSILTKATELYRAKEYNQAVQQYELILQYIKDDAGKLYNAACTYSLAGQVKQALSILKQAVEAGWDAYDHMNRDTDLDNLRNESDFKRLMADLLTKVEEEEKKYKFWLNPGKTVKFGEQEFELIGSPTDLVPETARGVRDLEPFNDEIYLGYGDGMKNLGPVALVSFQPEEEEWKFHFMLQEHLVTHFNQIKDELYIPGAEPYEEIQGRNYIRNYDLGNIFRLFKNGGFVKYRTVPMALHIQDIAELNGDFFCTAGTANKNWTKNWGCIYQSKDGCVSWTPAYNMDAGKGDETVRRMGSIQSFKGKLYAFGFAFSVSPDNEFIYYPDFLGENEAIVYDGKSWSTEDLIHDSGLLVVSDVDVFKEHLVLNAHFYDPDSDSTPPKQISKLYIYTGTGTAKKSLDYRDGKIEEIFIADDNLYVLLRRDKKYEILYTEDLIDFKTVLDLPEELTDVYCIAVHQDYLYFGTKEGDVYRSKL